MPVHEAYHARVDAGVLEADPAQEMAAARLSQLARTLQDWKPGLKALVTGRVGPGVNGVYLCGDVGRGKSMLMDLFFEAVRVKKKRRAHFHAFMLEVHAALDVRRQARDEDPIASVAKAIAEQTSLLCFDELQVTDIGDAMILGRLLEGLLGRGLTLVATSNRPPSDLYLDGVNRQLFLPVIAMLEERLDLIRLDAARDYRLDRLSAAPTWHAPEVGMAPGAQNKAFETAWTRLTCGEPQRPEVIHVQGRTLRAEHAAAGAARFTFEELCARPLGAADYLALAARFHTLFIEAIPRLTPDKRNEAKRFVTLIDALYETKTKLVAEAAASPDALYPQGDGAFEFQRTVSRLIEMQSRDYLGAPRISAARSG